MGCTDKDLYRVLGDAFGEKYGEMSITNERERVEAVVSTGDSCRIMNLLSGKRALLVDDVEINRAVARNVLESFAISVEEAEDGIMAVEKFGEAEEGYYDFIIMDIQMPKMNGYEATESIRKMEKNGKASVIVALTSNITGEDRRKCFKAGMDGHLGKPVNANALYSTLCGLMSGN